jgi:hypothetical protein
MTLRLNIRSHGTRLIAGWCAFLLYLGGCSPLGFALAALAGSLDPNHQLLIDTGSQGGRLILHHGGACASHHHGLAARGLTLFAQPATAGNPDHILQFCSADTLKGRSQTSASQPESRSVLLHFNCGEFLAHNARVVVSAISADSAARGDLAQVCLRSTVLLI